MFSVIRLAGLAGNGDGVLSTVWDNVIHGGSNTTAQIVQSGSLFALIHCGIYGVSAYFLRSSVAKIDHYNLYSPIMRFMLLVAGASLTVSFVGMIALYESNDRYEFIHSWLAWWIGDMSGLLVLVPVFIGLVNRIYPRRGLLTALRQAPELQSHITVYLGKVALCLLMLVAIVIAAYILESSEIACLVFFLVLPQMWIVFTESSIRLAVSLAIFSFSTAFLVSILGVSEQAYIYQVAISVIACSAYLAMAVPALVSHNKKLYKVASIDFVTQALSRQQFIAQAAQQLKRDQRYSLTSNLVLFDIDNFKQINDQFGHLVGDEVLETIAQLVRNKVRQSDLLGRFGGDEFMLLLPQTSLLEASKVADTIRQQVENLRFSVAELSVTCSFGVATCEPGQDFTATIDEADKQLLQAKRNGRNRVVSALQQDEKERGLP